MREIDTVEGLAEYIGTTAAGIYNMRSKGEGPRSIRIGGRIRYRKSEVDAWLDSQAEQPRDLPA